MFTAHIRKDGVEQPVEQHLSSVSTLCDQFGSKLALSHLSRLIGALHDLGKYTAEFNQYIHYSHLHPNDHSLKGKIPHSLQGALYLCERFHSGSQPSRTAIAAALCIASHHSGLMDCISPIGELPFYQNADVAPHAGAWIEIGLVCASLPIVLSLPTRERGLK